MQVLDREAVADLRKLYAQRDLLLIASRMPWAERVGEGSRDWMRRVTEEEIARYEAGMTEDEIAEARS